MTFSKKLITWYLQNQRIMPWRETKDPYCIWLSEIILQQTRVAQGMPYYLSFIETFPTVFDLAAAEEDEVLKLWQGLGYYSRARNLHATAKYVAKERNGVFPSNYKELLLLKGIGDYTASAISSICFNEVVPVVDGNVYRVLSRYFEIHTPINSTEGIKEFKRLATELIDKNNPATHNQAIMEFGALHCKPKKPLCLSCVFKDSCGAFEKGIVDTLPYKIRKLKVKKRYFNYLIFIIPNEKTIIQQRKGKGIWQNLYEFPLIESSQEITTNDIKSNTNFKAMVGDINVDVTLYQDDFIVHKLSHQHLYTKFYIITTASDPQLSDNQRITPLNEVRNYPVPILLGNFIDSFF